MTEGAHAVEDYGPENIEDFRRELLRKMNNILQQWRSCKEGICRRTKACVARNVTCSAGPSRLTPQQRSRARYDLHCALHRRLAELGHESAAEPTTSAQEEAPGASESRQRKGSANVQDQAAFTRRRPRGRGRK
jgi:hypothetical protein